MIALINYFYDILLLKEGNGINFQRASYTLDRDIKIYTNKVDSITTTTGKLLNELANINPKEHRNNIDTSKEKSDKRK
jgi:condensin complex subunit 2